MDIIRFLKPKNQLEEGGRTAAPVQQDEGEPEKTVRIVIRTYQSVSFGQISLFAPAVTIFA